MLYITYCRYDKFFIPIIRGGVLKDVLEDILKSLTWASKVKFLGSKPQVLENCTVLGSRTALLFEALKFCWKTPETSRKTCEHLFCFPHLEHRRSQKGGGGGEDQGTRHPIEISPTTKICQKSQMFLQFQFLFNIFRLQQ